VKNYKNPFRACIGLSPLRIDMGVDFSVTKASPIYSIGFGRVVRLDRGDASWPGGRYIAIRFARGKHKGRVYYLAEDRRFPGKIRQGNRLRPLKVGSGVAPWTKIATLLPEFPNCETGWARNDAGANYPPLAYGCYREGDRTAAGDSFSEFLHDLGAPRGLTQGRPTRCPLPAVW
jgi:hypothetical protein